MKDFSQNNWGLVLAGGGGKGAYQIGVFRALFEKGLDNYITAVSGASVGALNLVLFECNDIKMAESVWSGISYEQFLEISPEMIDFKEGLVSREGLLNILDNYVDLEIIRKSERRLMVSATEYDEYGMGKGKIKYFSLNYRTSEEIKNILLASSALPLVYEPVQIENKMYRDGGIRDNLPIEPLYVDGIRHFIVVGLSVGTKIPYEKYPDAEFIFIKPSNSIGDFWDGTLDFSKEGAKVRMELGYLDGMRTLEFSDRDLKEPEARAEYEAAEARDYNKIIFFHRKKKLEDSVQTHMDQINSLIDKYS
ncbi:MAG: patatin-like phospholipase family protein [Butyrivibrio sp.]